MPWRTVDGFSAHLWWRWGCSIAIRGRRAVATGWRSWRILHRLRARLRNIDTLLEASGICLRRLRRGTIQSSVSHLQHRLFWQQDAYHKQHQQDAYHKQHQER